MSHAERCPVCNGSGKLADYGTTCDKTCHGCNGKGWVEVGDNTLDPALIPYIPSESWKIPEPYPWYPWYPTITWRNPETLYYVTCTI